MAFQFLRGVKQTDGDTAFFRLAAQAKYMHHRTLGIDHKISDWNTHSATSG